MLILSHRGYWKAPEEKNKDIAFKRSFDLGFGTETDVRDYTGKLIISHDMPKGHEISLEGVLETLAGRDLPLAINIKADGLMIPLKQTMLNYNVTNWFVFDMSIPDMRPYLTAKIPVFTRMSEVEQAPIWLEQAEGVWLDAFSELWYNINHINSLLQQKKRVCVVSPELHGRKPDSLWEMLYSQRNHPALLLCTDQPENATQFFGNYL